MIAVTVLAPAKINLFLQITGERPDGYHDLQMLMQSVSLADRLSIRLTDNSKITIECSDPQVPGDRHNLAYKAVSLLRAKFPELAGQGCHVQIAKQIPVGGGLAGGSTNGAGVLYGLNVLCQLGLSDQELADLALQLGSDVPFCLSGGTAIALGRGEILTPITDYPTLSLVIAKRKGTAVATAWAYQTFRSLRLIEQQGENLTEWWQGLLTADHPKAVSQYLYNDLERVVLSNYLAIAQLKQKLSKLSLGALMSGSGACVFAICADGEQAKQLAEQMQSSEVEAWAVQTLDHGCCLL